MKLIVGLGNPDKKYEKTYHNIGFMAVEKIAKQYHTQFSKKMCNSIIAETYFEKEKVILAKPMTYMNLSGTAVYEFVKKFKLAPKDVFVVVDDIDLEKGKYRFRENGSAGSHNGMKDIVSKIGTEFPRLRIGIGRDENLDLATYVLSRIDNESLQKINVAIDEGVEFLINRVKK